MRKELFLLCLKWKNRWKNNIRWLILVLLNYAEVYFFKNVSAKNRVQDNNLTQLKIKVNGTFKKDEKVTTNFEPFDDSDVINKAYLDEKLSKLEGHLSLLGKDYNEFKLLCYNQSVEEVLIQRAVNMTIEIFYKKGLFDNYDNTDEVYKDFLFTERRRPDLDEVNGVIHYFNYKYGLKNKATSNVKILSSPFLYWIRH